MKDKDTNVRLWPKMDNPIREIRAKTGLSQVAFAERYGIPKRTVENWERGVNAPPQYVIDLLAYKIEKEDRPHG